MAKKMAKKYASAKGKKVESAAKSVFKSKGNDPKLDKLTSGMGKNSFKKGK
jgi:hypothetical protein